jgi:hypothetical protein
MSLLTQGIAQVTAAAKAGMSERTARKYAHPGRAPSQAKVSHTWRTRPDPFVEVWPEVEALLRQYAGLQAKTIWMELNERHAGRFSTGQLRTLQRRLLAWRATSGPDREVFVPQTHVPGEQAQSDFTDMRALEVMIAGRLFPHLLSASGGRDFTERYRELIDHYGMRATRNFPGNAHENGDVESADGKLKSAIDQRLRSRGSHDFTSREAYEGFLETCVEARNATRNARIDEERAHLRALPARPLPAYRESYVTVSRASAVRVLRHSYSVSSRLIGRQLRVRLHADIVELDYKGECIAVMERRVGRDTHRIDYRHIIHTLVRKPGAFRHYVFREALFPTLEFRRTYDALLAEGSDEADLQYARILHLAASDGEENVRAVLEKLLNGTAAPTYEAVRAQVRGPRTAEGVPFLDITAPDLTLYDRLLGTTDEAVCA